MHPRQCRANQSVIDLPGDRPRVRINFLPARFKFAQLFALTVDLGTRPIAHSARTLDSTDIIARERRISRAPGPKISGEFVERIGLLRLKHFASGDNDQHDRAKGFHVL